MASTKSVVFPGKTWEKRNHNELGIAPGVIENITNLMKQSNANGVLVCNGYLVKEWAFGGPIEQRFDVQSCTKSITSLLLGLAIKEKKIPNLDTTVKSLWPDFDVGTYTDKITFRHLASATSGISAVHNSIDYVDPGNMPPGIECRYHNDHCHQLACALTYIWGKNLKEILDSRILAKTNGTMEWPTRETVKLSNGETKEVVCGFAFSRWNAYDLARIGLLYLNNGIWEKELLVPDCFIKECMTSIDKPIKEWHKKGKASAENELSKLKYGLAWRGRNISKNQTMWYMSGKGGQFCVLLPESNIVMVKINELNNKTIIGIEEFEQYLLDLQDAARKN